MADPTPLLSLVLLCGLTPLLGWAMAAYAFRLSPRAAQHWLLAVSLGLGAQILFVLQDQWSAALLLVAPLFLASVLVMRRGCQWFWRIRPTDRTHLLTLAFGLLAAGISGGSSPWRGLGWCGVGLCAAWTLWQCAGESQQQASKEFNRIQTRVCVWPLRAVAVGIGVCGVAVMVIDGLWNTLPNRWAMVVLDAAVMASTVLSLVLGFMVVMRLINKLSHLSRHDALTDLLNRRAMEEALKHERLRHLRMGEKYAVVVLDIDHFKRINDTYGHAAGDAVLVALASLLKRTAREVDVVGRIGGEEFCLLLPNTGIAGALQAAERIRMAIERRPVWWQQAAMAVTVSLGVAEVLSGGEGIHATLARADGALHRAKAQGRNCAVVAITEARGPTTASAANIAA